MKIASPSCLTYVRTGLVKCWLLVASVLVFVMLCSGARPKPDSLCNLQNMSTGSRKAVRIAAIAEEGIDMGVLSDSNCHSQLTWYELKLKSERNHAKLHNEIEKSGKAAVVFSGELYGPPEPDPKLPDSIRKNYHPGWGHLGSFRTKLVVFEIESVSPAGKPYSER